MAIIIRSKKHPDEKLLYEHDFTPALLFDGNDVGDTIITTADPDTAKHPAVTLLDGDGVITELTLVGSALRFWIEAGTEDTLFKLTVHTAQGRILVDEVVVKIRR